MDLLLAERVAVVVTRLVAGADLVTFVKVEVGRVSDRRSRVAVTLGTRADRILGQTRSPALAPRVGHQSGHLVSRHLSRHH